MVPNSCCFFLQKQGPSPESQPPPVAAKPQTVPKPHVAPKPQKDRQAEAAEPAAVAAAPQVVIYISVYLLYLTTLYCDHVAIDELMKTVVKRLICIVGLSWHPIVRKHHHSVLSKDKS